MGADIVQLELLRAGTWRLHLYRHGPPPDSAEFQRIFVGDADAFGAPARGLGAGPFGTTIIDHVLRSLDVEYLIIGGAATHQCVEMTIRGAFEFGYLFSV
jgi:nicotinamidase-related amidase